MNKRLLRNFDIPLAFGALALSLASLVILSSASLSVVPAGGDTLMYVKRQALSLGIGVVLFLIVAATEYSDWARYSKVIYVLNTLLLLAVLIKGRSALGAQRWLGPLQPSEIAKISIIITLATFLVERNKPITSLLDFVPVFAHVAIPMAFILRQPDLGTSLVFLAITFGTLFMAGAPSKHIVGMAGAGLSAIVGALWLHMNRGLPLPLREYQIKRLIVFINPKIDPLDSGYHVIQSQIAVGSGGIWGKGLFAGTQNRLNFLPEQHTDFIFSVIGEELGFAGCIAILALYFLLLWRIIKIMQVSRDQLGCLLAAGVFSMISFHVLVNVGMTLGVMPITGIPLPFVSFGGNSLLTNMVSIGLVESVAMRRQKIMFGG